MTVQRLQIIRIQIVWMLAVVGILSLFDELSLPLFFSSALAGLLVLTEMGTPRYVRPFWITGLRRFVLGGLVVFALYAFVRVIQMVPPNAL